MNEKYYKVIAANGLSPTKSFNYSDYLPKDGKPGKWLPEIKEAEIRKSGYYASKYWNMWYVEGARIYEVEAENVFTFVYRPVQSQQTGENGRFSGGGMPPSVPAFFWCAVRLSA